jgi:hypothetical protein
MGLVESSVYGVRATKTVSDCGYVVVQKKSVVQPNIWLVRLFFSVANYLACACYVLKTNPKFIIREDGVNKLRCTVGSLP